jgi:hypothetical protein
MGTRSAAVLAFDIPAHGIIAACLWVIVGHRHAHQLSCEDGHLRCAAPAVARIKGDNLYSCDFGPNTNRSIIGNRQKYGGAYLRRLRRSGNEVPPNLRPIGACQHDMVDFDARLLCRRLGRARRKTLTPRHHRHHAAQKTEPLRNDGWRVWCCPHGLKYARARSAGGGVCSRSS